MICTLFTGQTSKEGIFMRYTYEYKMDCIEKYRLGTYPQTPEGICVNSFRSKVRMWNRIEKEFGPEGLKAKNTNRFWTPEEKLLLISQVSAGKSYLEVAISNGLDESILRRWVRKYKINGYNGLINKAKGCLPKESKMEKNMKPTPLTESEREELIRLRAENEYIIAENEVIKKRSALRQEKEAAQLKAKKQQSSRNSAKKDIN